MNYIYPAVFYPEDDGRYSVIFPDLNNLATYGDSLADAFAMAGEACGQYLFTSLRDGEDLPAPSELDAVEKDDENAIVNMVCVNLDEYARAYNGKTLPMPVTMCKYTAVIEEKSLEKGLEKGRKEGRKEGREEERLSAIRTMLEFGLPKDQILKKYSEDEYAKATHGLMHV